MLRGAIKNELCYETRTRFELRLTFAALKRWATQKQLYAWA
jgi:hypothetical protein